MDDAIEVLLPHALTWVKTPAITAAPPLKKLRLPSTLYAPTFAISTARKPSTTSPTATSAWLMAIQVTCCKRKRAHKKPKRGECGYVIPREGAVLWTDVMAIPVDASNKDAALKYINYILQPKTSADISNFVAYANANAKATPLVDAEIRNNPGIYPPAATYAKLLTLKPKAIKARDMTRAWTR